ncbi:rho GTPase-activating protein 25 isoform X2 [Pleurodeles waltl]|uniref:rho GTPase-activating protein 25 isoform X2 n=1 Tax=Pleurodeles waltl TaxID=8319 RepID=UPI003709AD29
MSDTILPKRLLKMSLRLPRNWDFHLKADAAKMVRSKSVMTGDQTSAAKGPLSPPALEPPLKAGWLKKQRSIVRNWQPRYFVLRGQRLCYYKDEEDGKAQGCIFLQRSTIRETFSSPEDAGKFIFEIIPGLLGDPNRSGQDAYVLMANSQGEMEEWIKAIKRAAGTPTGVVFGQRLSDTVAYEQKYGQHLVPILMEKCADFLRENGLNEEGVFRLPGQDNLVKQLRNAFDAGERPSFDRDTDVHTVASLFKLYLRELPEPVIPWSQYEDFLLCGQFINTDEDKARQELLHQVSLLPKDNYNLLSFICRFLHEIQLNSAVNKMSVDNLATIIGVNLIRPKQEDPVTIMKGAPQIQKLMTVMISSHEQLFPRSQDVPSSPSVSKNDSKKAPVPRSSVGWDAAEDMLPSRDYIFSNSKKKDDPNSPTESNYQSGPSPENCDLDPWIPSPRKRTQTLPTRKCSFTLPPQGIHSDIFGGEFWASTLSSEGNSRFSPPAGGHKRTLSEEFSSIIDLHRKSTYDNVPAPSTESADKTCTSPLNKSHSNAIGMEWKDASKTSSQIQRQQVQSAGPGSGVQETQPESLHSLQCLVKDLKNEVETQKRFYEERIGSLEKENYEVWAKVVKLNEAIEMEKNKCSALEIRLRNVERSREDAEKRNKSLEQEIQGFIKSMGDPPKMKPK